LNPQLAESVPVTRKDTQGTSPFGSNPERAYRRQAEVLRRMVEDGYISAAEAKQAQQEKLQFRKSRISTDNAVIKPLQ